MLVVKVDLDHTESLWGKTPEQLLVTDHNGVVILTSRQEWRFRATRPLSDAEREAISSVQPYPTRDPKPLNLDANAWLPQTQSIEETGWSVSILAPRTLIDRPVRTVVAIGGAALLVLMLLLGLMMQRRRHYLDRIAFEAKARHELEGRVAERTSDLEGLNRRLKQEVLEREQAQQELVRAQDDLVQAGKLSALGTMSASISHELNQPLAAIRSYAENAEILLDHQRTEDARGNLKLISELTGRMASIIAHLRAFARRDRHAPESVALQPALDDALALLAKRRRSMEVELIRDLPAATLWVEAGETRLRQVLGNLLANALDALTEKGPPRKLWLSAQATETGVNLYIRDNGPGFCMEALGRAGEPFYTTKTRTQGLGLGLAICDTLMRAFGGELSFANHKEGGALITLKLRAGAPRGEPATVRGPKCMTIDNRIEVVLIDDDPHLRQALSQTLDLAGLKILPLAEAKGVAAQLPRDWPGVVVSDIRMPGMDGLELLGELHAQDPELPVLLITGHGDVPLAVQAMRAGAYDFLEKNLSPAITCSTAYAGPWPCADWCWTTAACALP
nr:hypothetical protein GCM10020185_28230 [Pseudomonas brassicacearum subsp. brassicacearum]